jgi:hypothetical protein
MIVDEDIYLEHFDDGTMIDQEVNEFLEHYGVLGMKWGVRNDKQSKANSSDRTKRKNRRKLNRQKYKKQRQEQRQEQKKNRTTSEKVLRTLNKVKIGTGLGLMAYGSVDTYFKMNPAAQRRAERGARAAGQMLGRTYRAAAKAAYRSTLIFERDTVYFKPGTGPAPGTYKSAQYIMKELTP